jgi:hypothetical protein
MKDIETLIPDIHELIVNGDTLVDEDNLAVCLDDIRTAVTDSISNPQQFFPRDGLRVSKLGKGDRKIYFEAQEARRIAAGGKVSPPDVSDVGPNMLRFLTGHVMEAVLLLLAKEAGHSVEMEQGEVEVSGVLGHIDAIIDGNLVDVKTASQYGIKKFEGDTMLMGNDPYGYITQLSTYWHALKAKVGKVAFFWALNKSNADMMLTPVHSRDMIDAEKRIERCKEILEMEEPPTNLCYEPVPSGNAGNMALHKECGWCDFRDQCWAGKGVRAFKYSNGPVYLSKVVKPPRVDEIKGIA